MKFYLAIVLLLMSVHLSAQKDKLKSFENMTDIFLSKYVIGGYVDYASIASGNNELKALVKSIGEINISDFEAAEKKSFLINAYNILVIDQIMNNYPTSSVKEIGGFFNRKKYKVAGENLTLDEIEKDHLLGIYNDSRFHFVLICGAKDCPKIWSHAYTAEALEDELNARTAAVLNDTSFLKITEDEIGLSEIFRWNRFEFGGESEIINFINTYRNEALDGSKKVTYYDYNWTLNDVKYRDESILRSANNSFRYVTSAAIPKGGIEVKLFNNLYTQKTMGSSVFAFTDRSTYFTTSLSFLYGRSNRLNIGFSARYRRVRNANSQSSVLDVFQSTEDANSAQGVTAFGPQIRWAPIKSWTNFSIQSSLTFPLSKGLSGGNDMPFLDWAGPVFLTQFFNDKAIGNKASFFTEVDLLIEEIGGSGKSNRVSTPMTAILSWFPIKNMTFYGLLNFSPYYVKPFDYFWQYGIGSKYQISRQFEVELLYTDFSNRFLYSNGGQAATYNLGFRYSR